MAQKEGHPVMTIPRQASSNNPEDAQRALVRRSWKSSALMTMPRDQRILCPVPADLLGHDGVTYLGNQGGDIWSVMTKVR
jgi:hypothetical protein